MCTVSLNSQHRAATIFALPFFDTDRGIHSNTWLPRASSKIPALKPDTNHLAHDRSPSGGGFCSSQRVGKGATATEGAEGLVGGGETSIQSSLVKGRGDGERSGGGGQS